MTKASFFYFRVTGKYYTEAKGELSSEPLDFRDEVRKLRAAGALPGVVDGTSFIIVVFPEDLAPFLLLPEGM